MGIAIDIAFYAGTACYLAAALLTLRYARGAGKPALVFPGRLLAAGVACFVATFVLRWVRWGLLPLTTTADSLVLFVLLSAVLVLVAVRRHDVPGLLCFHVPPLAAVCLLNAVVAHPDLHAAPRALRGLPLSIHVGAVFLAYALFFLASTTSAAYLYQARRLKRHQTAGLFQRLPSLEELDRTLYRLVAVGYPLFAATLGLGVLWAWLDRDLLQPGWWHAPKVLLSVVMVLFFAVMFHMRRSGRLRGPKLALLVFSGFSSLLVLYVVSAVLHLRTYNFWGTAL